MSVWIAGITRGHNGAVCLLRDGEIVFAIEEERLTRLKYDGSPMAAMTKILEYTDRLDYMVMAHTDQLGSQGKVDYTAEDVYTSLARKLKLIGPINRDLPLNSNNTIAHPQVIDLGTMHHRLHAACAFYRSGFDQATAVIVDGAGSVYWRGNDRQWEVESIFTCSYPNILDTVFAHRAGKGPWASSYFSKFKDSDAPPDANTFELLDDASVGIVKAYEAVTSYCGWGEIEAGKTMGLSPYGRPNANIPPIYNDAAGSWIHGNRDLFVTNYPQAAYVNIGECPELDDPAEVRESIVDVTMLQNRRDLAYAVQTQSQEAVLKIILKAVEKTGCKNVVLSGGYGLNCVANYYYLTKLNELGINLYVEPISSDAGTSIGAALFVHHSIMNTERPKPRASSLYLGFEYTYSADDIRAVAEKYQAETSTVTNHDVVQLLRNRNIVAVFRGRSESGPRALGNRSILFDPTVPNGKDFVNSVKHREYFRPFAGSILHEHVNEWFDMRGMEESPHMMYAVNCQPGKGELVPSIIHVDGTCRIQTVKREQNPLYYDLISDFYAESGVPVIFNTSFNLGGEPLVETLDDAVRTLANSDIEYLYLMEFQTLITVKNHTGD